MSSALPPVAIKINLTEHQKAAIERLVEDYEDNRVPSVRKITQWFYSMDGRIKHGLFTKFLLEPSNEMVTIYRSAKSGESYKTINRPMYVQGVTFTQKGISLIKELKNESIT